MEFDTISPIGGDVQGSQLPSQLENVPEYDGSSDLTHTESQEYTPPTRTHIGTYPFDPFNPTLLESDLYTTKLLAKLNPTSNPTFYNYGNIPPMSVLDLGCGQGNWMIDAAVAWKGYGTKIIGYDMVDISQGLLSRSIEHGVIGNVSFVQGNFLQYKLPFSDETFDLVRMSCLSLCITSELWRVVLQEVHRVLATGGRLELIDDAVVYPYRLKSSSLGGPTVGHSSDSPSAIVPQLIINIPSASLSRTSSIYNVASTGHTPSVISTDDDVVDPNIHELGPVEEEADVDDTGTINRPDSDSGVDAKQYHSRGSGSSRYSHITSVSWSNAIESSKNLEGLFDHMLLQNFDIRMDSSDFIPGLMNDVFGFGREMCAMHLGLTSLDGGSSVGLVLQPSTLLPMDQAEIGIHATRYPRLLLSCKEFLVEHALDVMDEEIDELSMLEVLRDYEAFLPYRLGFPHWSPFSNSQSGGQNSGSHALEESPSERGTPSTSVTPTLMNGTLTYNFTHVRSFRIYEAVKVDRTFSALLYNS
ncbi:hypothetical protein CPB84DRAFT_1789576 [Gymnopilus junonius]|uniref:Methyltransferase domain-containing protein n=1 Tax=Gymnopilus junonius TaxID=109634 RepID=A0A9P5NF74_GYMJU|nr:hypothetical protein CPB84DRAFT_1789576 [Gymnopilus junonius]